MLDSAAQIRLVSEVMDAAEALVLLREYFNPVVWLDSLAKATA